MNDIRRRLDYRTHLTQHLAELSRLTNQSVSATDLLSLDETDRIRKRSKTMIRQPKYKTVIPFSERSGPRMIELVTEIYRQYPQPVYLWTEHANECGALRLASILDFRLDFDFNVDTNGVFTFQTENLEQKNASRLHRGERGTEAGN